MINYSFVNNEDNYIVNPVIRKFCKEHKLISPSIRQEGLNAINKYAGESSANNAKVNEWVNVIIKEGIKHIYLRKFYFESEGMYNNINFWKMFINKEFQNRKMQDVNNSAYSTDIKIQKVEAVESNGLVTMIKFNLSIFLYEYTSLLSAKKILYPIFIDLDLQNKLIIARAKSKSKLFLIKSETGSLEERFGSKTTTEKLILQSIDILKEKVGFNLELINISIDRFYKAYYKILKSLTSTPEGIKNQIEGEDNNIKNYVKDIFEHNHISSNAFFEDAVQDQKLFLEKYISISCLNRNIFTEGKQGYPIKLIATDSEFTRIEETSADKKPLQCKASFYDYKKVINRQRVCDGMYLLYNRINTMYFGKEPFIIKLQTNLKGYGFIRIEEYVEEGDIQNVLSGIIKNLE